MAPGAGKIRLNRANGREVRRRRADERGKILRKRQESEITNCHVKVKNTKIAAKYTAGRIFDLITK
jgi:hypothetical protein